MFAPWRTRLPRSFELVPIELPGRGARFEEAPIGNMRALVDRLLPEVSAHATGPFMVFGHGVGAKIAFELTRMLARRGLEAQHLFVAASPSGSFPAHGKGLHGLPRPELVTELRRAGTPEAVLRNERLLDLLLPSIRADLELAAEYEVFPGSPLACPITAFAGASDVDIPVDDVACWGRHTTARFELVVLDAGHNFIKDCADELVEDIARAA